MPRPLSMGLNYISLDVSFFQDRKVKRLVRRHGERAPLVYIALLCTIYSEGYYIKWDDDISLDLSDATRMEEGYINEVLDGCFEVGLLSREMFKKHGILTSHGIQKQYQSICEQCKRKTKIDLFSLLQDRVSSEETPVNSEETPVNSEETPVNSEETPVNSEFIQQSKVKKRKEKNNISLLNSPSSESELKRADIGEEEREKIFILKNFISRNFVAPNREFLKFKAKYGTLSTEVDNHSNSPLERAVRAWKQLPEGQMRFSEDFLSCWVGVVNALEALKAPTEIILDALSDKVKSSSDGETVTIRCSKRLYLYIEEPDHLDAFRPTLRNYLSGRNLKYDTDLH